MRALFQVGLALAGLRAPAWGAAAPGARGAGSCQAEAEAGVSLIQTRPGRHGRAPGPAGKPDPADLAEEGSARAGARSHRAPAHAKSHHRAGLGEDDRRGEDSRHRKGSGHRAGNSTLSARARRQRHRGHGERDGSGKPVHDSDHPRASLGEEGVKSGGSRPRPEGCTVRLFRDGIKDCQGTGLDEKVFTTTELEGEEFRIDEDDNWMTALVSGHCTSVDFYDHDRPWKYTDPRGNPDNVQVPGFGGCAAFQETMPDYMGDACCVKFPWDMQTDMGGVFIVPANAMTPIGGASAPDYPAVAFHF